MEENGLEGRQACNIQVLRLHDSARLWITN